MPTNRLLLTLCIACFLTSSCSRDGESESAYYSTTIDLQDKDQFVSAEHSLRETIEDGCGLLARERAVYKKAYGGDNALYSLESRWPEGRRLAGYISASESLRPELASSSYHIEVSLFESGFIDVASIDECRKIVQERIDQGFRIALLEIDVAHDGQ